MLQVVARGKASSYWSKEERRSYDSVCVHTVQYSTTTDSEVVPAKREPFLNGHEEKEGVPKNAIKVQK